MLTAMACCGVLWILSAFTLIALFGGPVGLLLGYTFAPCFITSLAVGYLAKRARHPWPLYRYGLYSFFGWLVLSILALIGRLSH